MGTPVRIGLGARDLEQGQVELARRDTKTKESVPRENLASRISDLLEEIQSNLLERARAFQREMTTDVDSYEQFKQVLDEKGGFIRAHWDGTPETEARIKEETKATIRCIPLDAVEESGVDMLSGKPSSRRVLFARAY